MSARIQLHTLQPPVLSCLVSDIAILRHFVGVTLRPLFNVIHLCAPSAAEDNLRHVPATPQDVSDIQDLEESAANAATSGHGSHQIQIRLRGEAPEENDRYQKHLAASHESRCADGEVQHRNGLCAVEDAVGSDTDEDGSLRQSDTHDPLEGNQLGLGLGPFEVGCHALGECDDARDTDGRRYRLNDGDSQRGRA